MTETRLLLGDEAVALGALHAGLKGVYAYPGTPSTEITEFIQKSEAASAAGIHCTWSTNEKTAMEEALGMSYAGCRSMVCMKHVGMNVAADAFVNAAMTGVNGGLVVVAADDPSMHSSQNEQDSRFYGKRAMPSTFPKRKNCRYCSGLLPDLPIRVQPYLFSPGRTRLYACLRQKILLHGSSFREMQENATTTLHPYRRIFPILHPFPRSLSLPEERMTPIPE